MSDHAPGDYVATVARAKEHFARGDLFEVVPGQTFRAPCPDAPSAVFRRLVAANPAPYGALINLGGGEFLVAASPEMFVRVRASGSRPARSPARSRAAATRSRTPTRSARSSRPPRTRRSSRCARTSTGTTRRASASRARSG